MTGVVLLLTGPLQSWGSPAPGIYLRPTASMPSFSGIVGLIANSLGRHRCDPIDDLAAGGQIASRADRPGMLLDDFQTIGTLGRYALVAEKPAKQLDNPIVTNRHYLQDAAFLAVYTPPPNGISAEQVFEALLSPARPLYLGRRGCPPGERIPICVTKRPAEDIFATAKLLREPLPTHRTVTSTDAEFYEAATSEDSGTIVEEPTVTAMVEMNAPQGADPTRTSLRQDVPHTFDPRRLYYRDRRIISKPLHLPASACVGRGHEAVAALYESLGADL